MSWLPWVRVWGWASYRFLPFSFFLLACPFVSRVMSFIYDVRVRGVVSMFNEPLILSLCGVVRERLLPCRVVVGLMDCIVYADYVYPAFVSLFADISCLLFLFRKCCFVFLSFPLLFHHAALSFLSLAYWPFRNRLLACLIRAAILHFSFRLHLFTSRYFVIGSPD